ncbi:MAG: phosphatidate cytidylyltransferase [Christensenellales bacterium]|nr:phosphatidate cytidylyltransferase [Christensenellales bacterium]
MVKRVVTGTVFTLALIIGTLLHGWTLRFLLLFSMTVSVFELYHAFRSAGKQPVVWVGYVFCALTALAQLLLAAEGPNSSAGMNPMIMALIVCVTLAMIVVIVRGKIDFEGLVLTLFPMLYPGLFYVLILSMVEITPLFVSIVTLCLTFFVASINDVFALLVGIRFGKHKLSPRISPKKSVEGAVAGLVSSVLFAIALPFLAELIAPLFPWIVCDRSALPPTWSFAILGLVSGALSQVGDLVASLVKRHCGIKDFGTLFPGHGGMMDRMDGVLLCGVACSIFYRMACL